MESPVKHIVALIMIVVLFLGCGNPETQVDTNIEVPVSVEEISLKNIEEYFTTTGTVDATGEVMLLSEITGFYRKAINPQTSRPYGLGDYVSKGEILVYLDNPEQENTIRMESITLNLEISEQEFEKQQALYELGGVTLRELKNAESSYINAKYNYENAQFQLAKMKITAPFDGIIVDMPYYTEGVKVGSNSDLVQLMNYSTLAMEVSIPGKQLGQVTVGQPVRVMNYTMPDKLLPGKIAQVSPALNPETRSFKATVDIDNPDLLLRPGMFVKAEIVTSKSDSTIVIPKDVMLTRRNRRTVFIVESGFARERRINGGLENPDEMEVVEGLATGERLVVSGFETLRNGSRVTIVR